MSGSVYAVLPALARFDQIPQLKRRLARADALKPGARHELAVGDGFQWPGDSLPVAALIREHVVHDAGEHVWLCADLAHCEPDMTGVRVLAIGSLTLTAADAEALAAPLRPLFGDSGMPLETTLPSRWHLRLPADAPLPQMEAPGDVLGDDLARHLPEGAAGRRWRQILNETQIVLHQHALNRQRAQQGQSTVNSLWLWGAGRLPAWVKANVAVAYGDDLLLAALADKAGVPLQPLDALPTTQPLPHDVLLDLGGSTDPAACSELLLGLLDGKQADALTLHFAGGERWRLTRAQRWRFWRHAA
ncbi:MAG TPA: phosphoglycerate mutase [Rhodanobacteraceae bacterium]